MTYNKPQIVTLGNSIKGIQGFSEKPYETTLDVNWCSIYFGFKVASSNAYEADE